MTKVILERSLEGQMNGLLGYDKLEQAQSKLIKTL